jgi:hypothetical protein
MLPTIPRGLVRVPFKINYLSLSRRGQPHNDSSGTAGMLVWLDGLAEYVALQVDRGALRFA